VNFGGVNKSSPYLQKHVCLVRASLLFNATPNRHAILELVIFTTKKNSYIPCTYNYNIFKLTVATGSYVYDEITLPVLITTGNNCSYSFLAVLNLLNCTSDPSEYFTDHRLWEHGNKWGTEVNERV
jgi:hypothetical protein